MVKVNRRPQAEFIDKGAPAHIIGARLIGYALVDVDGRSEWALVVRDGFAELAVFHDRETGRWRVVDAVDRS